MNRFQEQMLVRRLKRRDARAAEEFTDAFGARVHALARRYARTEADAEDLTQEVFIDLCRAIHGFRGESALSTWVYRVALNHCLKHRRGRDTRPETLPLDDERNGIGGDTDDPLRHAARAELSSRIDAALAALTPEHREVVLLHELHGLTYGECAEALGVPVGTVKSRLSNAFKRLRGGLLGEYVRETEGVPAVPAGPMLASVAVAVNGPAGYVGETKGDARP
jgi:RNA polymerase sigma-70 factor (ECF subfamily)